MAKTKKTNPDLTATKIQDLEEKNLILQDKLNRSLADYSNLEKHQRRLDLIKYAKKIGYFIATGSIVDLPGQTIKDLAKDILWMKKYSNMASFGPFIPCEDTPLAKQKMGDSDLTLKIIAILRLIKKTSRIPVVTALETIIGEGARRKALLAGANALMMNLTPEKYRQLYKIYPNKFFQKESVWEKFGLFKAEESYQMLEERLSEEITKNKF